MRKKTLNTKTLALISALMLGGTAAAMAATVMDKGGTSPTPSDFSRYDANGDGYVTQSEFAAMHKEIGAFKDADGNRDGRLNEDEYLKARAIDQRLQAGQFFSDAWISTKVKALLLKDSLVHGVGINVDTKDGRVQLSGWVNTSEEATHAVKLARSVDGVKLVIDDLVVNK